ncbi:hypothetical protein [Larkinella terrae]|uniref:Uncharacterized protein n=1 Tax=Larkinella terrae TaxID=2025311 RepID=A0A7K0EHB9_9BACT|nr:hypothetical protein [Larkinella terrae]MRS61184.1 hypothetical protein [Larkinella terrae]
MNYERKYRPERLPQAAERSIEQENLHAALDVVRRIHRTSPAIEQAEPTSKDERWAVSQLIRPIETETLRIWAIKDGYLLDEGEFTRKWKDGGEIEGGEHQVYAEKGLVYKRNNLLYHTSWLEYFHRLVLHNWLFRETAVRFEGLMEVNTELQPVISQKAITAVRGATRLEVEFEMNKRGFKRVKQDNYIHLNLQILVEDLHDENVLVDSDGDLLIFDPVIYLT